MTRTPELLIVHETVWHSIVKDTFSICALTAAVGLGIWLDSPALQWVAGVLWIIGIVGAAMRHGANRTLTIDRARKRLDEIEAAARD